MNLIHVPILSFWPSDPFESIFCVICFFLDFYKSNSLPLKSLHELV